MSNFTATIENWAWHKKSNTIVGYIYGDLNGRFEDGTFIKTSTLKPMSMNVSSPKEGAIIQTLNSSYKLGKKN